jgi:hypothetical protein
MLNSSIWGSVALMKEMMVLWSHLLHFPGHPSPKAWLSNISIGSLLVCAASWGSSSAHLKQQELAKSQSLLFLNYACSVLSLCSYNISRLSLHGSGGANNIRHQCFITHFIIVHRQNSKLMMRYSRSTPWTKLLMYTMSSCPLLWSMVMGESHTCDYIPASEFSFDGQSYLCKSQICSD